ncbi:oxygen-independent coproporphyrinogen III oxidase [Aureimonas fodinaquatilis]|uniref:Coproporphyrinogen-III oxidase n=1 Tax=Aureimonas fodinaquatilis TaxID=2565783 RepID=A0A5B0DSJ5_9HYPH|nr:oxygen-independent coproporphyrinogen III oxidase [Aureimonas fodinaquatilis]KAA0968982.1 oxygen-independent coproporphyrinogen III oxidase [Aureimonas fodinaquatilis]
MSSDLIERLAGQTVPRYTSYPTAADFDTIEPADHARWLRTLEPGVPVSVYLHVPYCQSMCFYCGCHTKVARRQDIIDGYCRTLLEEIRLVCAIVPRGMPISRIAWGGGTPSILGSDGLAKVLAELRQHFCLAQLTEHSIELDPRHIDMDFCDSLAAMGVNRVSLGVQDTDPAVQAAIGRVQPIEQVETAVSTLRAAGIQKINFDLIYGLPQQTVESLKETCNAVAAMTPDRIACYGYAHLPKRRANQRLIDEAELPGPRQRLQLAQAVTDELSRFGYQPIGIDHYSRFADPLASAARNGRLHRNFQGYTDDDRPTLLGFGASAISQLPGGFVQSQADIAAYRKAVEAGQLPTKRGHAISEDDRLRASVIEQIMCNFRVDLADAAANLVDELALLRTFAADRLVEIHGTVLEILPAGRPYTRLIAAVFDRYRTEKTEPFSGAV